MSNKNKFHLISLGCARNLVDSEVMAGVLKKAGWESVNSTDDAEVVIINTCGFIEASKKESIDTILDVAGFRKIKSHFKLVVAGCLSQRFKEDLVDSLPEVDLFIGTDEYIKLPDILSSSETNKKVYTSRTDYIYNEQLPRINSLSPWSAYLKVAEGCQHNCSFCAIPQIRGPLKSRPLDMLLTEAAELVNQGVIELNLIAQDLAAYGRDVKQYDLYTLLEKLISIDRLQWIRLLYFYPENITDKLIRMFLKSDKLTRYLDIPVQHASDEVLKAMRRNITRDGLRSILSNLKEKVPDISIRTSIIVGFPGETDKDFEQLCDFVLEQRFDHLGCFSYSQEEGTSAVKLPNQISEKVKEERVDIIMNLQKTISKENLKSKLHKTLPVLVEGLSEETDLLYSGRLATQAPEVDGIVYINEGEAKPGTIQLVHITECYEYDLLGKIVQGSIEF